MSTATIEHQLTDPTWLNTCDPTIREQFRAEAWQLLDQVLTDEAELGQTDYLCTATVEQLQAQAWQLLEQCLVDERQIQPAEGSYTHEIAEPFSY
jgi:hypothetical protein